MTERRADDATRDVINWLKCKFMENKVGQTFPGTISGITSFGIFVTLDNIYIDGLVHISNLDEDEYFIYDEIRYQLIGDRTSKSYKLGDKLTIIVVKVDLEEKFIDFALD